MTSARSRTNGETSPSFTAFATVTGLVRNSQIVAAARTMLTIAIKLNRLRPICWYRIGRSRFYRTGPTVRVLLRLKRIRRQHSRIAEAQRPEVRADCVQIADDQDRETRGIDVPFHHPVDVVGAHAGYGGHELRK